MHTEIEIIVDSSHTDELSDGLQGLEEVISLSVVREASIKPPGDVLTVHALNRGVDDVLRWPTQRASTGMCRSRRPN